MPIYPTPVVGMVGLLDDVTQATGQGWQQASDAIYLLGVLPEAIANALEEVTLGGSEYLAVVHKMVAGRPPKVNVALEKSVQAACRHEIQQGWVQSAHDCAEGGLAVAITESCIRDKKGARIELPTIDTALRWDRLLFDEGGARIIVSVAPTAIADWEAYLQAHLAGHWQRLGMASQAPELLQSLTVEGQEVVNVAVADLATVF